MQRNIFALVTVAALTAPSASLAAPLNLICFGGGSANKVHSSSVYAQDNNGNFGTAQVQSTRQVGFEDQVNVEINDDDTGRIRAPRTMLPPLHGGDGGWFAFKNIKRTEQAITGSAGINFINSPKVRIDRITGTINISGKAGDFVGKCELYSPENVQRKF